MSNAMIRVNDFTRQWQEIGRLIHEALDHVGRSGWYVLGQEVRAFEAQLAAFWGRDHAVGVASGLDALEISLRCLGIKSGDRVLTTPVSAFATTLAIVRCGAAPVFVDVDDSGLIDLDLCDEALSLDSGIKGLIPVHLYGHALDLDHLAALQQRFEVLLIEDCAQSIGSKWKGRPTGSVGDAAATSFYPTKNLGTLGDGGAVLTCSSALAERARSLRHYGQTATYHHDIIGLNSRLDELHAAFLGRVFLPRLEAWNERRRQIAARYCCGIDNPRLRVMMPHANSESAWHLFPVLVDGNERAGFRKHMEAGGVETGIHYPILITEQEALRSHCGVEVVGTLRRASRIVQQQVSLPVHPFLADEEVETVIDVCNGWRA